MVTFIQSRECFFYERANMPKLTINDLPVTQSDMMNRDHAEFVLMLNKLIDLIENEADTNMLEVDSLLAALHTHTQEHFSREEALMVRADFPPYPIHKLEHDRILTILKDSITHWRLNRNRKIMGTLLMEQLPQWLINHVATMDSVTSQFLASSGVTES